MGSTLPQVSYFRLPKRIEMYQDLYEYLILNRQLNLPGIGTFLIERKPAETDISHRQINSPAYTITLQPDNSTPAKRFFYWLADKLNIHYHEAIVRFNSFVFDLRSQVLSGSKVTWANMGTLTRGMTGEIRFDGGIKDFSFDPPVSAARIIREKAVHTVRVGEQEKTSVEMTEWLNPEEKARSYWWAPSLIVAILLAIIIGLYFSQEGASVSSAGNQQTITPQKASGVYTILQ
ncbi:MAG: hypothetical protein Q8941_07425 [Bacteroidota bacterium]|nr:hypothetical protein [Bacteroidota bacterium]